MARVLESVITAKFQTGDMPSGADFAEFIENCYNVNNGDGTKFLADNGQYLTVSTSGVPSGSFTTTDSVVTVINGLITNIAPL